MKYVFFPPGKFILLVLTCLVIVPAGTALADEAMLRETYKQVSGKLHDNIYGVPIYIESNIKAQSQRGDVYSKIYHPFEKVKAAFSKAQNWCDIAPLHLNIKACTYKKLNGDHLLTFYSGRKYFEEPEDTYQLVYRHHVDEQHNYLKTTLSAEDGPMGTSDYIISVEILPLNGKETFIHFSYSYNQGFLMQLAMKTYLATLGREKVGFTIVDTNGEGEPVYIDGIRGIIERNAMRYYFTIQAYLDTLNTEPEKILVSRLNRWFDLTELHHKQLYEMDKKEYLEYKQKERIEQNRLQEKI